ncbi:hypothetical protein MTR67_026689 [Solanum verrucosum]|uniref:Integrase zinc-binding domain-containing protein n=1 Tax=Solanum verrucosum TaxID=315347 RepID=A0AAF0R866_SOLVR|nr:hypothetical protein MTR67_026689 [Solanum verrucosum]
MHLLVLDPLLLELKKNVHKQKVMTFEQGGEDVLRYQGRLCVINVDELQERIMAIDHSSRYSIHPDSTNMYHDLREVNWGNSMKRCITNFIAKCPNCQQGVMGSCKKGKLSPRYIGPYTISKRVGNIAYELELPSELAAVHLVFHISMLKKCLGDPSIIVPTENIGIKDNLSYEEIIVQMLYGQAWKLRTKRLHQSRYYGETS